MKNSIFKQQGFIKLSVPAYITDVATHAALQLFAANSNLRPNLRQHLRTSSGWNNFSIGVRTESNSVAQSLFFHNGNVSVKKGVEPGTVDSVLIFSDEHAVKEIIHRTPNEILLMLLNNQMRIEGNMSIMSLFNYYLSLTLASNNKRKMQQRKQDTIIDTARVCENLTVQPNAKKEIQRSERLQGNRCDSVRYLNDPFLSIYRLDDFPRIQSFIHIHFNHRPDVCSERPHLITEWFKSNGFEQHSNGTPWHPALRQAHAFSHLMSHKSPIIRNNDLLGGTTTRKEIGVVLYPDAHATLLWSELLTLPDRTLNPYDINNDERELLHKDIFPFWLHRNFKEWVRTTYNAPLCQKLDERFAVYFSWKTVALSHTTADFPTLLSLGIEGLREKISTQAAANNTTKNNTLEAMDICLGAISTYATNIASTAQLQAKKEPYNQRKEELHHIAKMCTHISTEPPQTLDEALQLIWIGWIALHMENTNAGLSLGRMDQWLQPYFSADMDKLTNEEEKQDYIKHTIEMLSCFFMRCTDHLPTVPDIGNYLFGGSSSTQAITLGGITPNGESAVNDMTFIFLKVTEMLKLRDPNVNARYHHKKNSDTYLQRLCEVNLITCATPSIHADEGVIRSLEDKGYEQKDINDWSVVGCVEPSLSGKHMGHTGCAMFNMVAALEMAMNQGKHPLMNWSIGPDTGAIVNDSFPNFECFFDAFKEQLQFLVNNAVEYNNMLGEAHSVLRPTPLLSSMMDGCIDSAKDVTKGGARYNTSGVACIGLSDVIDSLMVIKKLVYDNKKVSFIELKKAIDNNFEGHQRLHATVMKKVPKFGSGDIEAIALGKRVTSLIHQQFSEKRNFRGGQYTTGFWSMSNHVAFGNLTGALPSGRKSKKAFTPGLTPSPQASKNLLDNIKDVAQLDPKNMDNNVAFNVKYVPSGEDSHQQSVSNMASYVKAYSQLGGMQMQMNIVSSATLKDAMLNPDNYRDLLVRISGYNAYFVTLNREMQIELIERAQYNA